MRFEKGSLSEGQECKKTPGQEWELMRSCRRRGRRGRGRGWRRQQRRRRGRGRGRGRRMRRRPRGRPKRRGRRWRGCGRRQEHLVGLRPSLAVKTKHGICPRIRLRNRGKSGKKNENEKKTNRMIHWRSRICQRLSRERKLYRWK